MNLKPVTNEYFEKLYKKYKLVMNRALKDKSYVQNLLLCKLKTWNKSFAWDILPLWSLQ